jgi:hypothetical protein
MNKLTLLECTVKDLNTHPVEKAKWIAALRSEEYHQAFGNMCDPSLPNSACCLHVLEMEVGNKAWESGIDKQLPNEITNENNTSLAHEEQAYVIDAVRFNETLAQDIKAAYEGQDYGAPIMKPSGWNDTVGLSFNQIADLLEYGVVEW